MKSETKFYGQVKKKISSISWIRLENNSLHGTPDLLGYNTSGHFFTLELKVTKGKKIRFSPHQIAFHVKHPQNSFILVQALDPRSSKHVECYMYRGSRIMELEACGFELEACSLGLEACVKSLEQLGA